MNNNTSPKILILYASQTGTAQYLAEELYRMLSIYEAQVTLVGTDEYEMVNLPEEKIVFFLVSTAGDGVVPTSMQHFWQFLLIKNLPKNSLSSMQFSVFGLGDSSYAKFNWASRKLRARLLQLGAGPEIPESAFGDDQHPCGQETEFMPWALKVIEHLNLKLTTNRQPSILEIQIGSQKKIVERNDTTLLNLPLTKKLHLTPLEHPKQTINFLFKCEAKYNPGDVLQIKPQNQDSVVKNMCNLLGYDDHQVLLEINWKQQHHKSKLPQVLTLWQLLKEELDLTTPPTRYFIKILAKYADNPIHKEKLEEMCQNTPEGLEEYYRYVYRERRNPYEILFDFQPCKVPIDELIQSLNLIRMREYSISTYRDGEVGITVALVQFKTKLNRTVKGFCSAYLESMQEGDILVCKIKGGLVNLPKDCTTPVIMIGPGTGVAPFISFLEQRQTIWNQSNQIEQNKTILFFGACYVDKEFYYKQMLEDMQNESRLTLFTAFSRDAFPKVYVQTRIMEQAEKLRELIKQNLDTILIVVAGTSRNMPQQVEDTFREILGQEILQALKTKKQYIVECW